VVWGLGTRLPLYHHEVNMASTSSACLESDSENTDGYLTDEEQSSSSTASSRKKPRLIHSKTRFNPVWTKKHPCIVQVSGVTGKAYCTVCSKSFSVCHQGYSDVERHMKGIVHQSRSRVIIHRHERLPTTSYLKKMMFLPRLLVQK